MITPRTHLSLNEWQIREIEKALSEADQGDFAADKDVELVLTRWSTAVEHKSKG
jgi:predicted transcriptional regulator